MGAFADMAERLIERGYATVPIIPGTKRPGFFDGTQWIGLPAWQTRFNKRAPTDEQIVRWGMADTGIGIVGGPASRGMVGFDIDTDDPAIRAALETILPATPVRKIGRRGETLFYFAPQIGKSRKWIIEQRVVCELIGPHRQTVIPPSIHPDTGQPYRWSGLEGLDAVNPDELPPLPDDFVDRVSNLLVPFGYHADTADGWVDDDTSPHRQLNDAALANLAAWVPALPLFRCRKTTRGYEAVPIWRPSATGRPDQKRACNLKIVPAGIRDFGADQGYTPLDLVMRVLNYDLDRAFKFLADLLGWTDITIDLETAEKSQAAKPQTAEPQVTEPPASDPLLPLTYVPGVLGDIVEHIVATARRPNRVLALSAAVTVVGTLIGRRVAGPTRSATHLYVVAVAPTGNGKQHVLDCAVQLMKAAGAGDHIGPAKFFSLSAMVDMLSYKPLALCMQDEIGVFLKAITSRHASSHEAAVSQILRSLWGISFATMPTPAWATKRMSLVSCPAISILGVSTPEEFYSALQGDSINNGFLNRFLVLQSHARITDCDPARSPTVPEGLRDALCQLYIWSGPESLLQIANPNAEHRPDVLPWASTAAATAYSDFVRELETRMDDRPDIVPYVARCGEIAVRLATIRAASRWGRGALVDVDDMTWAATLATTTGEAITASIIDQLPDNERSLYADKLLAIIRRRGSVKVRDIQQHIRSRLRSAEIKDIVCQLIEAGEVEYTSNNEYRPVKK
jgi:hypothetical protein